MKKVSAFLTLFLCLSACTYAQVEVGLVGGVNFSSMTYKQWNISELKGTTKFGVGAVAGFHLTDHLTLRFEPTYLQKGAIAVSTFDPDIKISASFFELPLLLKYSYGDRIQPYLLAGPVLGIRLTAEFEMDLQGMTFAADTKSITETLEYAVSAGAGVAFKVGKITLFLESRYTYGLNDLCKPGNYTFKAAQYVLPQTAEEEIEVQTRCVKIFGGMTIPLQF
jgi:hypothetical protein